MTNDRPAPVLTKLSSSHLPQAVALSTEMGWPYRLEDWQFAHQLGEGLALEEEGKLIGTAMLWHYGDTFTSVGMIIVSKQYQGFGYGSQLVDALLASAGSRSVFLNGTAEAVDLYARRGFDRTGALNQHQAVPTPGERTPPSSRVRKASADDLPLIMELDESALGMPRTRLLEKLAAQAQLSVITTDGTVTGYAACREFGRGYVIGPVIAQTTEDAVLLIDAALSQLPGQFVRVDTSADSGLSPLLEARGLPRVETVTQMVRGELPRQSRNARVFALCSQSLG